MAQDFILNIFVVAFVIIALGFITIKSWILVLKTFSEQRAMKSNKPPSPTKTVIEYFLFAVVITLLSVGMLYYIHNHTKINLGSRKQIIEFDNLET